MRTANQLDRRRQAQIANQTGTINRLLARFDDHTLINGEAVTSHAAYGEEMSTLYKAIATYQVENEDLRGALRAFVTAIDAMPMDAISRQLTAPVRETFAQALSDARALVTPVTG